MLKKYEQLFIFLYKWQLKNQNFRPFDNAIIIISFLAFIPIFVIFIYLDFRKYGELGKIYIASAGIIIILLNFIFFKFIRNRIIKKIIKKK